MIQPGSFGFRRHLPPRYLLACTVHWRRFPRVAGGAVRMALASASRFAWSAIPLRCTAGAKFPAVLRQIDGER